MPIFDEAQKAANEARRRLLSALASGGNQALEAQRQADAQMSADRKSALADTLKRAAVIGAPEAHVRELQSTVAGPFDARRAALGRLGSSRQDVLAAIERANTDYFGQLNAAIPVLTANVESSRAARAAKAQKELSDSELRDRLLGAARQIREERQANVERYRSEIPATPSHASISLIDRADKAAALAKEDEPTLARRLGIEAGLDPNRVYGIIDPLKVEEPKAVKPARVRDVADAASKLGFSAKETANYTSRTVAVPDPDDPEQASEEKPYIDSIDTYEDGLKYGLTPAEIDEQLRRGLVAKYGHDYPKLRQLVRAMYEG